MIDLQFRVLYGEFLFRLIDLEVLSADALGDASKLLGRFAALLVTISIFLSVHALEMAGGNAPAASRFFDALRFEHFLIAITMLVVGLFAVLSWDSTFPDRRDVLVLAPLPVRAWTFFMAKASAAATGLGLAVLLLHGAAGMVWPLALGAPAPLSFPALTELPASPPVGPDGLEPLLNRDLAPILPRGVGVAIGVVEHGQRHVLAYGSTRPDALVELEAQLRAASPAVAVSPSRKVSGLTWAYSVFKKKGGYVAVAIIDQAGSAAWLAELVAQHVRQRLEGDPAISLATVRVPASDGIGSTIRIFLTYWTVMLAAGVFTFCCVLGVQGIAAQLLPRQLFLRLSSFLQLASFGVVMGAFFRQPLIPAFSALIAASGHGPLAWSPSYWFLGLFQQLSGSLALAPLAHRAWISLGVAIGGAALAYALCYSRTLRKIVEEPDIVSGGRGGVWLPRFGSSVHTAIVQFSVRTLLRSRLHRLILVFYIGMGFAYLVFLLKKAADQNQALLLLVASVVMMAFCAIGTRVIFSLPLDLRANWIFRVTGVRRVAECLIAGRRALLLVAAAPVWAVSAALCFRLSLGWATLGHLAVLALFALVLAELCLYRFDKIPFTCSYLPGKSQLHLAVLSVAFLMYVINFNGDDELAVLQDPAGLAGLMLALVSVWVCVRWRNATHAQSAEAEVRFEEVEAPAVQGLGLTRDGSWPIGICSRVSGALEAVAHPPHSLGRSTLKWTAAKPDPSRDREKM